MKSHSFFILQRTTESIDFCQLEGCFTLNFPCPFHQYHPYNVYLAFKLWFRLERENNRQALGENTVITEKQNNLVRTVAV